MYKGFYIDIAELSRKKLQDYLFGDESVSVIDDARKSYDGFCETWRNKVKGSLDKYIDKGIKGKELVASFIEDDWFPPIKADVFLSHSHKDEKLIVDLAAWLRYYKGLNAFIDSQVWHYCDDLLYEIHDSYCRCDEPFENLFDYEKVKQSTTHVYMLLNSALMKMIDEAKYFIFVGTVNSGEKNDSLKMIPRGIYNGNYSTFSPWLYSELLFSRLIRQSGLDSEVRKSAEILLESDGLPPMRYDLDISHLTELSLSDLHQL